MHIKQQCTLWGICSVVMFCYVFTLKFQLLIGLHSSCNISPSASGTFQKSFTKYHDWPKSHSVASDYISETNDLAADAAIAWLETDSGRRKKGKKRRDEKESAGNLAVGVVMEKLNWMDSCSLWRRESREKQRGEHTYRQQEGNGHVDLQRSRKKYQLQLFMTNGITMCNNYLQITFSFEVVHWNKLEADSKLAPSPNIYFPNGCHRPDGHGRR